MPLPDFPASPPERFGVLAFDFGTQHIGMAYGQNLTGTAQPLDMLPARDGIPDWNRLEKVLGQWQPSLLLVGIPFNMDGSRSEMCARAEKFGRRLEARFRLPCYGIDERLSSAAAEELREGENRRKSLDSLAAQIILESWFAELAQRSTAR